MGESSRSTQGGGTREALHHCAHSARGCGRHSDVGQWLGDEVRRAGADRQHRLGARRARRRPVVGVGEDTGRPRARRSTSTARRVKSERARLSAIAQRLQAVAQGQRAEAPGSRASSTSRSTRSASSSTERRWRRCARRRWSAAPSCRGSIARSAHDDPDLVARPRQRGLDRRPAARRTPAQASRSRSSTAASTSRIRASTTPATPAQTQLGDHDADEQQGHRRQGLQQQGREAGLRRRGGRLARDARRRHGRLQRPHAGRRRRRRHPVRPVGRRAAGAARQLQRLPRRHRRAPAPRTSSTPSKRRTRTASTSPT